MTYYLICDPSTGKVVRRSHDPAALNEDHLSTIKVSKQVWNSYRAGDDLLAAEIEIERARNRWIKRVESVRFSRIPLSQRR